MGLDGVELIMKIEESFDISIEDKDAQKVRTVNDLYCLVKEKLNLKSGASCKTSPLFYKTRRSIINLFNAKRNHIKPNSCLSSLIPQENIRDNWKQFESDLSLKIQDLERPDWLQKTIMYPTIFLVISFVVSLFFKNVFVSLITLLFSVGYPTIISYLTKSEKKKIPKQIDTLSDFVYQLLVDNPDLSKDNKNSWNDRELFKLIQVIISDQMGIALEEILPEASLVDDLGID